MNIEYSDKNIPFIARYDGDNTNNGEEISQLKIPI